MSTNRHFLVTAGPTREKIDQVRDWGNIFTGKTGLDVALAFLEMGGVTLLTSNAQHVQKYDGYAGKGGMMGVETFSTHADLRDLLAERMTSGDRVDAVAMTAAVADYSPQMVYRVVSRDSGPSGAAANAETWVVEPAAGAGGKIKSNYDQIAVLGTRTAKLIDMFRREWSYRGILIKFKLEVGLTDEQLIQIAGLSRHASDANLIVANTLAMARPAEGEGGAYLIDYTGPTRVGRAELATKVVEWVKNHLPKA